MTCVDSYHYFGTDKAYFGEHLLPLVKKGGWILIAVPGLKQDIHSHIPEEMLYSWSPEDIETLHDASYWRSVISETQGIEIVHLDEMESFDECWNDWLACDNRYARGDHAAMSAGAGQYMNFVSIILRRK